MSRMQERMRERWLHLVEWVRARPKTQVHAFTSSVALHTTLLLVLAFAVFTARERSRNDFAVETVDTALAPDDLVQLDIEKLGQEATSVQASSLGAMAPALAPATVSQPTPAKIVELESRTDLRKIGDVILPETESLSKDVTVQGAGAEHVGGVEGAVDRIATEVLHKLEKGRLLLVWAFDASGSLQTERERLVKHIETVYQNISKLDGEKLSADGALLSMVVSFGKERKALLPDPTAEIPAIASAISSVGLDTSGVESTFETTLEIARKWGKFKRDGQSYQTMVVIVTDEVGDDEARLEDAIAACRSVKMPIYVLGSAALFGQKLGYVPYTDPRTKQFYPSLPVRQGPESLGLEMIHLPFWYDGPQYNNIDSGFGPYALSRLSGGTGGIYFITRLGPQRVRFEPSRLREYRPDWNSPNQYQANVQNHPIRKAVLAASQITQSRLPGQPSLLFPPVDGPEFKEEMTRNQETAARISYTVDMALEPITAVVKSRDREPSRRWQAHYDLIRGRLLAMKIRCLEFNWACADMKKNPRKFQSPASNAWRLVPETTIHYSDKASEVAKEAQDLLKKVVKEHPGTPWATLAARELKDPFGFKWVEGQMPPQRRNQENVAAKKAAMTKNAPPPEPPKL